MLKGGGNEKPRSLFVILEFAKEISSFLSYKHNIGCIQNLIEKQNVNNRLLWTE